MRSAVLCKILLGLNLLLPALAFAQSDSAPGIHQLYVSPRAMGMGNAFVGVANDYTAMFYNPAGLARREDGELNLSLGVGLTPAIVDLSHDIDTASKQPDSLKNQAYADLLTKQYGKTYGARIEAPSAILARPGWGFGFIPMDLSLNLEVNNTIGPAITPTVYADTTIAVAYADDVKRIEDGRLSWGITGKFVDRGYFRKPITVMELAFDSSVVKSTDFQEGYTVDADVGVLYTPIIPGEGWASAFQFARPTFGLVVRNVAETGFGQKLNIFNKHPVGDPEKLYRTIDFGSRWEYPSFWLFSGRGVLDIKDINHPNFTWRRAIHAGFEFDWTVASWWRGQYRFGISEGYLTYGASAMFAVFNVDLVSYAQDIGSMDQPKENRIYLARLSLNF